MVSSKTAATFLACCTTFLAGCEATLGTPGEYSGEIGTVGAAAQACQALGDGLHPGPSPIRRLTRDEYDKTIASLTGLSLTPARDFPAEARALGFHGVAEAQTVSAVLVESYKKAAEDVAVALTENIPGLMGCDPTDPACVGEFLKEFGGRAYRRPLDQAEVDRLLPVFAWGRDNLTLKDGVQMVMEVLLQSPDFLYRPEFGAEEVEPGVVRLTSYEMATRLSYLFLGTAPDAELRAAAAADELKTPEQIAAQVDRLFASKAAREVVRSFHAEWLHLEAVERIERDAAVYPGYSPAIRPLLREETESFIEHVIFEDDASLRTLFTAPYTFVNQELAGFYGYEGVTGTDFVKVETDPKQRAGLLTQASLMAHHAQPLSTSPVHRGKFIRESILCQFLKPPPANLAIIPPDLDPNLTTRERFAEHSKNASCAGCHKLMDPVGLGFEHYDSVGRYRELENGLEIDASGEFVSTDVDGKFVGGPELGAQLAESGQVAFCMSTQWVRFAYGRSETPEDACSMTQVGKKFESSGLNILELVRSLTTTDAFYYRKKVQP